MSVNGGVCPYTLRPGPENAPRLRRGGELRLRRGGRRVNGRTRQAARAGHAVWDAARADAGANGEELRPAVNEAEGAGGRTGP